MDENYKLFGIWIPGEGWLKVKDDFVVIDRREMADEVAANIGAGATARFIDRSPEVNQVLQELYLSKEKRSLCRYFKNMLRPRIGKSANSK